MKYLQNILTVLIAALLVINTAGLHVYTHYCTKANSNSISIYSTPNGCSHEDEDDSCCHTQNDYHPYTDKTEADLPSCCSDNSNIESNQTNQGNEIIAFNEIDCCIDSFQYFILELPFIDQESNKTTINVRQPSDVLPIIENNHNTNKIPSHLLRLKPNDYSPRTYFYQLLYQSKEDKTEDHLS